LQWDILQQSQKMAMQQAKLDNLASTRQKRVAINCNEVFANIETIKQARDAAELLRATTTTTNRPTIATEARTRRGDDALAPFMHQFHVNDAV
jgi:hypothetical protein